MVSADFLNAMYKAQDVNYGRLGALQTQVTSLVGSLQNVLDVQAEDRRERGKGFETLVAAVREVQEGQDKAREEQRSFYESQAKLLGGLATSVNELRNEVKDLREKVGEPKEKGDGHSLHGRLDVLQYMLGEVAEVVEDRGANVPEGAYLALLGLVE